LAQAAQPHVQKTVVISTHFLAMKLSMLTLVSVAGAVHVGLRSNQSICISSDRSRRAILQTKLAVLGVPCEEMCRDVGSYPNCDCPGFDGREASSDDTRACFEQHCGPTRPCPSEQFVSCVKASTKLSALQWGSLLQSLGASVKHGGAQWKARVEHEAMSAEASTGSCDEKDAGRRALLQTSLSSLGPVCEEMCRDTGSYPNCNCPGFNGEAASSGDVRSCHDRYCQDPSAPCPTDQFFTCVQDATKASLLQWSALFHHVDSFLELWEATVVKH